METKCLSMDEFKNSLPTHTEIVFSLEKERNISICNNMDETGAHYAKEN